MSSCAIHDHLCIQQYLKERTRKIVFTIRDQQIKVHLVRSVVNNIRRIFPSGHVDWELSWFTGVSISTSFGLRTCNSFFSCLSLFIAKCLLPDFFFFLFHHSWVWQVLSPRVSPLFLLHITIYVNVWLYSWIMLISFCSEKW